ncbi:MAG TPA: 1-acyl-sn-glycerol-3-phosphate acyltransferase [Pseudomonadales bacterium]|nr:1-acyl-sn-glycerol-3-phosphate acyltransferase [Pseudomonadales bacterium]
MAKQTTIFTTPVITPLLRGIARLILRLIGWKIEFHNDRLPYKKCVIIGAWHTSNWDFALMLVGVLDAEVQLNWMGKHTIFPKPIAWFMRWLGGIPVNRTRSTNMTSAVASIFDERDELKILLAPEGTRSTEGGTFKSGFYYIAHQAGVPIAMAYIDAERKVVGLDKVMETTGDYDKDLAEILAYYEPYKNKGIKHV